MNRSITIRWPTLLGVALAVFGLAFTWGYFAHRDKIFPYPLAKRVAIEAGMVPNPAPQREIPRPVAADLAALSAVPYVGGTTDPHAERSGVYLHETEHTSPGWNFFSPLLRPQAFLLDMDGEVVHSWRADSGPWQHAELLPDGGLLALVKDERLLRLDRDSQVLWSRDGRFHHDLSLDPEGRIHVLDRGLEQRPEIHPELDTLVDRITVLSPDGEVVDRVSLLDLVLDSPYAFMLPDLRHREITPARKGIDILHTNHVEVFDGRLADRSPLYAAGNLLLSMRTPSIILIADPVERRVLWIWGPSNLVWQHHPTLLDDGHLLLFNNGVEHSEVIELDPVENRVVWRHRADDLFSRTMGSVQRLPNGNTLITESDTGYVFEVTPQGDRVWAFANPFFTDEGERMAIWRMTRLAAGDPRLPPAVGAEGLR